MTNVLHDNPALPATEGAASAAAGGAKRRPRSSAWAPAVVLGFATLAIASTVWFATRWGASSESLTGPAASAARSFLERYVDPSGRVVRRDQGGDTVSEGQAYGLLLSQALGDQASFGRIWAWTARHLLLADGELRSASNATGAVENPTPASDADVLTAWALSRATGPGAAHYHSEARRMSRTILANETVRRHGRLLLAAGPWATGPTASLDPSSWALTAFAGLARFTGDRRWSELAAGARTLTASVTRGEALLPPDWVRLDRARASATPSPNDQSNQVLYGLDAQRLVVWMSTSCEARDREVAARWWAELKAPGRSSAIALSLRGEVVDHATNALPLVAGAAAAGAAGNRPARARLLRVAQQVQARYPTYYGGAWLALGEVLLGTDRLGGCAGQGGSR